jgi:hypothetical protein
MSNRLRFAARALAFFSAVMLLSGCMSMAMQAGFSRMLAPDSIPFHKNPQIGDYSVLSSFTKSDALVNPESVTKSRYEIVGKQDDLFVVTLRYVQSSVKAMENFGFEYWVDKDGSVKKAFMLKGTGNAPAKTPMNIARKNESGYILYTDLKTPAKLRNSTRSFANVGMHSAESFTGDADNNSKMITYFAFQDDIPFRMVYGRTFIEMNMLSSSTSQIGNMRTTMYTREQETMATITKLIESGNAVRKTKELFAEDYELTEK